MTNIKKETTEYINNEDFRNAIIEYQQAAQLARKQNKEIPLIPNFIGKCFLQIANGLAKLPKFSSYSYCDEMKMDAVENCVKVIHNFNINAETKNKNGIPSAFAYFTQICYYAFLRRLAKEKKQREIKERYLYHAGIDDFIENDNESQSETILNNMRNYYDHFNEHEEKNKPPSLKVTSLKKKLKKKKELTQKERFEKSPLSMIFKEDFD
jgi:hypothetical protein